MTPFTGCPPDCWYSSLAATANDGKSGVIVRLRQVLAMSKRE